MNLNIEYNFFQKHFIPMDAVETRKCMVQAADEDNPIMAASFAICAVAYSIFNTFGYLIRGVCRSIDAAVDLNPKKAWEIIAHDSQNSLKSVALVAMAIPMLVAGLFAKESVYEYLKPYTPQPEPTLQELLDNSNQKVEKKKEELQAIEQEKNTLSEKIIALEQIEQQYKEKSNELSQLNKTHNSLQLKFNSKENELSQLIETHKSLQSNFNSIEDELSQLKDEHNSLQTKFESKESEVKELQSENEKLKLIVKQTLKSVEIEFQKMIDEQPDNKFLEKTIEKILTKLKTDPYEYTFDLENDEGKELTIKLSAFNPIDCMKLIDLLRKNFPKPKPEIELDESIELEPPSPVKTPDIESSRERSLTDSFIELTNSTSQTHSDALAKPVENPFGVKITDTFRPHKTRQYRVVLDQYLVKLTAYLENENQDLKGCQEKLEGIDSELSKCLLELIFVLSDPQPTVDYSNAEEQLVHAVKILRIAVQIAQKSDSVDSYCQKLLDKLCIIRWAEVDMYQHLEEMTHLYQQAYREAAAKKGDGYAIRDIEKKDLETFIPHLKLTNSQVKKAPGVIKRTKLDVNYNNAKGAVGNAKDFTLRENQPHVRARYHYKNGDRDTKTLTYLRHACPVMPGASILWKPLEIGSRALNWIIPRSWADLSIRNGEVIAPDYIGFIEAIKRQKEAILIVNKRRREEPGLIENERDSVEVVEKLDMEHENVFVFTQAVEGPFYEEEQGTLAEVKEALKKEFFHSKNRGRCSLPSAYQNDVEYKVSTFELLLVKTKELFFPNHQEDTVMSLAEQQSFINLFYVLQKMDFIFRIDKDYKDKFEVKYFTNPCKDNLDRGGTDAMITDRLNDFQLDQQGDPIVIDQRICNLIGPAILAKNKYVLDRRMIAGTQVEEVLQGLSEAQIVELKKLNFEGWKIDKIEIPKCEHQEALHTIQNAKDAQELLWALEVLRKSLAKPYIDLKGDEYLNSVKGKRFKNQVDQSVKKEALFAQIDIDLHRMHITLNGTRYRGKSDNDDETNAPLQDAEKLFTDLKLLTGYDEEKILRIMCCMQQGVLEGAMNHTIQTLRQMEKGINLIDRTNTKHWPNIPKEAKIEIEFSEGSKEIQITGTCDFLLFDVQDPEHPEFNRGPDYPYALVKGVTKITYGNEQTTAGCTWFVDQVGL